MEVSVMNTQMKSRKISTSYKEVTIGRTLYRVTSVFSGEKDLGHTLEQLAVNRAMSEFSSSPTPRSGHASI